MQAIHRSHLIRDENEVCTADEGLSAFAGRRTDGLAGKVSRISEELTNISMTNLQSHERAGASCIQG